MLNHFAGHAELYANKQSGRLAGKEASTRFTGTEPFCRLGDHVYRKVLHKKEAETGEKLSDNCPGGAPQLERPRFSPKKEVGLLTAINT